MSLLGSRGNFTQAAQAFPESWEKSWCGNGDGAQSLMVLGWGAPGQATERQDPGTAQLPQPHPCCGGIGLDGEISPWLPGKPEQGKVPAVAAEPRSPEGAGAGVCVLVEELL